MINMSCTLEVIKNKSNKDNSGKRKIDEEENNINKKIKIYQYNTLLHLAVLENDTDKVSDLLHNSKLDINGKNSEGCTALFLACNTNQPNVDIIDHLLVHDADPNLANSENFTPLMLACKYRQYKVAVTLVANGADVNCRNVHSRTALHYAVKSVSEELTLFLLTKSADTNVEDINGEIPLIIAMDKDIYFSHILVPFLNTRQNVNATKVIIEKCMEKNNYIILKAIVEHEQQFGLDKILNLNFLESVYESKRHRIFTLLWDYFNKKELEIFEFLRFLKKLYHRSKNDNDFSYLRVILQTENLETNLNFPNIFALTFGTRSYHHFIIVPHNIAMNRIRQDQEHFEDFYHDYYLFMTFFCNNNVYLDKDDLVSFIHNFANCRYRVCLLRILLNNKKTIVTSKMVKHILVIFFRPFKDFIDLLQVLLEHSIVFDSNHLFMKIGWNPINAQNLQYILERFTPQPFRRKRLRTFGQLCPLLTPALNRNVKSLVEIARDAARSYIAIKSRDPKEFYENINHLNIPERCRDIMFFREPVNY